MIGRLPVMVVTVLELGMVKLKDTKVPRLFGSGWSRSQWQVSHK